MRRLRKIARHAGRAAFASTRVVELPPLAGMGGAIAIAVALLGAVDARADGGAGGAAGAYDHQAAKPGGAGGSNAGNGGAGGSNAGIGGAADCGGSGGGGGGSGGGRGGTGGSFLGGGAGAGEAGQPGEFTLFKCGGGGGGGDGGANGQTVSGAITISSTITGGTGGGGGAGGRAGTSENLGDSAGGGGGGGGAGGNGLAVTGAGVVTNSGTITGGVGGNGGAGGDSFSFAQFASQFPAPSNGGNGGDGGAGIAFTASGATLVNSGNITGGEGGIGGALGVTRGFRGGSTYGNNGSEGQGGAGVTGADLTIINSGSISSGLGGSNNPISNAIVFTGGSNVLTTAGGGSLTGNIVIAAGQLTLRQLSQSTTYGNSITGNGAVTIDTAGGNVVALTAANSYSGGTTVTAGSTLWVGNSQALGSGALSLQQLSYLNLINSGVSLGNAVTIADNASVQVDNLATLGGAISDGASAGSLTKVGQGLLVLSGASSYSGATLINAGLLEVDGSIASSSLTTVGSGTVLQGSGTVGALQVNSGATFAPGLLPGTAMTVAGNLAFQSGAVYFVQAGRTTSTSANVSGSATLAGTVTASAAGAGSFLIRQSDILHAASLSGTFTRVSAPTGFDATLNYSSTDVTLNLTAALGRSLMLSQNHSALVSAHNSYFNNGGALPARFVAVSALSGSNLTNALTQISGETPTATHQTGLNAATQFVGTMSDPTLAGRGGDAASASMAYADDGDAMAYAGGKSSARDAFAMITKAKPVVPAFRPFWNVWASGFGGTQTTDGNAAAGSNTSTSRIGGVAVGADYHLSAQTVAGFALAGGATNFSVAGGGSGRSDLFQLGGFVRHTIGTAYVTASAAYGWQDVTTDRTVNVGGLDQLRANFNTNSYSARLEGGNRYVTPWLGGIGLTPYVAAQVTYLDLPAYAETTLSGPTTFALSYAAKGITAPRSELGMRSDKSFAFGDKLLTLRGRAAWAHDFNTDRSASATFQSLPGASFVVGGASPAANAALTTASAELSFRNGITLGTTFEGEFSEVTRSYAGKGVVRYNW